MQRVYLESIQVSSVSENCIVVLDLAGTEHYLSIGLGDFQAKVIRAEALGEQHSFTDRVIQEKIPTGGVKRLFIHNFAKNRYYAELQIENEQTTQKIDIRPSDGLMVAMRQNLPMYVSRKVIHYSRIYPSGSVREQLRHLEFKVRETLNL